jgi:hypothetical protein
MISLRGAARRKAMSLRDDEAGKLSPGDLRPGQEIGVVCSLNEAWFHAVDGCANDTPLAQVIFPLMRNCFFGGAIHAVLLLQKGYGDRLAADIARFMMEEPRS